MKRNERKDIRHVDAINVLGADLASVGAHTRELLDLGKVRRKQVRVVVGALVLFN